MTSHPAVRPLALTCVGVTALAAVYTLVTAFVVWDPMWLTYARGVIHLAEACGAAALLLAVAAATGIAVRIGLGAVVIGSVAMAVAEIAYEGPLAETLFTVAPLVIAISLIVAGVAILGSTSSGWPRLVPLVLGLLYVALIAVIITIAPPPAPPALLVLTLIELGWVALGLGALATSSSRTRAAALA